MRDLDAASTTVHHATLRLTRGLSMHEALRLPSGHGSSVITIGASPASDWQIHAPGVAGHAMSIGVVGGEVCAVSGADALVLVNGRLLAETWQTLTAPAVFALGAAELELTRDSAPHPSCLHPAHDSAMSSDPPSWQAAALLCGAAAPSCGADLGRCSSHMHGPSVLGQEAEPRCRTDLLHGIAFGMLTAASYLAWLYLLDRV
jgi:hypothetical protein